jgi:hypothetical protein
MLVGYKYLDTPCDQMSLNNYALFLLQYRMRTIVALMAVLQEREVNSAAVEQL